MFVYFYYVLLGVQNVTALKEKREQKMSFARGLSSAVGVHLCGEWKGETTSGQFFRVNNFFSVYLYFLFQI